MPLHFSCSSLLMSNCPNFWRRLFPYDVCLYKPLQACPKYPAELTLDELQHVLNMYWKQASAAEFWNISVNLSLLHLVVWFLKQYPAILLLPYIFIFLFSIFSTSIFLRHPNQKLITNHTLWETNLHWLPEHRTRHLKSFPQRFCQLMRESERRNLSILAKHCHEVLLRKLNLLLACESEWIL